MTDHRTIGQLAELDLLKARLDQQADLIARIAVVFRHWLAGHDERLDGATGVPTSAPFDDADLNVVLSVALPGRRSSS